MTKKDNALKDCEALFTENAGTVTHHDGRYRMKEITAGPIKEIEIYPNINRYQAGARIRWMSEKQREKHKEAVRAVYCRRSRKQLERIINANFGKGDILLTLTYMQEQQPLDDEAAEKNVRNYLRRVRRERKRLQLDELKYAYTTEVTHGIQGVRYHHHLIINGGMSRDEV